MPIPKPPPSFSWQLLPSNPTMKHVRNTGRNLKRWGTRHGLRVGTSATEQARIIAARWIHIHTRPHTQPEALSFDNEMGIPWTYEATPTMWARTRSYPPYTLALVISTLETCFKAHRDTLPDQSMWRPATVDPMDEVIRAMGQRGTFFSPLDFVQCLYRAAATLTGYTPAADELDAWIFVNGLLPNERSPMLPVCADHPWLIAAMPYDNTMDAASWAALSFNARFLC